MELFASLKKLIQTVARDAFEIPELEGERSDGRILVEYVNL